MRQAILLASDPGAKGRGARLSPIATVVISDWDWTAIDDERTLERPV